MTTIVTRAGKGAALTWTEGDSNFTNLNTDKLENVVEDTTPQLGGDLDVNAKKITSVSNGAITLAPNGSGSVVLNEAGTGATVSRRSASTGTVSNALIAQRNYTADVLANMDGHMSAVAYGVRDSAAASSTFARAGGEYAVSGAHSFAVEFSGNNFTSQTRALTLAQNILVLGDLTGTTAQVVSSMGTQDISLVTNQGTNSGLITITNGVNGNISITPNGTGSIVLDGVNWPQADGTANQFLKTNGSGQLAYATITQANGNELENVVEDTTPQLGGALDVNGQSIVSVSNGNITITPNGTGSIVLDGVNWPQADGTNGQSLITNGAGQLSWSTVSGGGGGGLANVVEDLSPQLGGSLDLNGYTITTTSNGHIILGPNGTGNIYLTTDTTILGDINANAILTTYGTGDLTLHTNEGTSSGSITIANGTNGAITIDPDGSGPVLLPATQVRVSGILTTDSANDLTLSTNANTNSGSIVIGNGLNGNITIEPNGTGDVYLNSDTVRVGDSGSTANITSNGVADLVLSTNSGTTSGAITISGSNSPITIEPHGTGDVNLNADTVRIGDSGAAATLTTNGVSSLTISTNGGTSSGSILINSGANGNFEFSPAGTGDVYLNSDTVRIGDANITATLTTNSSGNLVLNTNAGSNSGSITLAQGVNGNISIVCNGTGVVSVTSPIVANVTSSTNTPAIFARHTVTTSASDTNPSINIQKHRSDIAFASMTDEPAVAQFQVRDSTSTNRTFFRMIGRYLGTGTNPTFTLRGSPDGFTTDLHYMGIGGGVATFGSASSNYTLTSNTGGNLILTANSNTTSGTITVASSTNANISITPNGTGKSVITNAVAYEYVYTAGTTTGTITPNAALGTIQSITLTGSITWNAFGTPLAGQTITMIITQPATGGPYTLTSTMLFAGASKTLSTAANAVDILTVTYDGTNYWASLSKGYA